MDNTPIYIKMADCPEIQGLLASCSQYDKEEQTFNFDLSKIEGHRVMGVWLPRQDQLQEMSGLDWRSFDRKCLVYEHPVRVPTKEQAGIRVVMKEKYNKTWSGEAWVNA